MAGLNRAQLAKFLPDQQSIRAFEELQSNVDSRDSEIAAISAAVTNVGNSLDNLRSDVDSLVLNDLTDVSATPTAGQVLTFSGSTWTASTPFKSTTTSYSANHTETTLSGTVIALFDATLANIVYTLPAAVNCAGLVIRAKKTDSSVNTVTLTPALTALIDGAATYALTTQYQRVAIVSDGVNWHII